MIEAADTDITELEIEVSHFSTEHCLILDNIYNFIWVKYHQRKQNSKKPHLYFPICNQLEKLDERLQKDQLSTLKTLNLPLYRLLASVQPFSYSDQAAASWLVSLYEVAKTRHEHEPEIESTPANRFRIGKELAKGETIYVDRLEIKDGDIISARVYKAEKGGPYRIIDVEMEIDNQKRIKGSGLSVLDFSRWIQREAVSLIDRCFALID